MLMAFVYSVALWNLQELCLSISNKHRSHSSVYRTFIAL